MLDDMSSVTGAQWAVATGAALIAAVIDVRQRRIPNALTLPLLATGLLYALLQKGLGGAAESIIACVAVGLPYVLLFVFAGGGAGDAKMMGALAAWLGLEAGIVVLVCVAAVGALFGVAHAALKKQLRPMLARIGTAFYIMMAALCCGRKGWALVRTDPQENTRVGGEPLAMPYGPAIFIGVCIGAFVVRLWNG